MHLFSRSAKIFTLVLLGGAFAFGQQPSPVLPSQSGPRQTQTQVTGPAASNPTAPNLPVNNGLAQPAFLTEVYGLQGVLAETVEGNTVASQSVEEKFNPAS